MKDIKIGNQPITLNHYPMYVWNKSHYGAWNLHGHIHSDDSTYKKLEAIHLNNSAFMRTGKILNVNIELWDFKPLSFDQLAEEMKKLPENWDFIRRV